MTQEEESLRALQRERKARVKRLLRWMPRRATMHRYPILKWFAKSARARPYLWSFRVNAVVPALYAGCILSFLPLYGVQVALAALLAFMLHANLPVLVALQAITNPLSAIPVYYTVYHIGRMALGLVGIDSPRLTVHDVSALSDSVDSGEWALRTRYAAEVWGVMCLGGAMMGLFVATIASLLYRLGAREAAITLQKLHALQEKRREAQEAPERADQLDLDSPGRQPPSSNS